MPGSNARHTLAILRRALRLTQTELAELAGCSPPTIQSIELLRLKLPPGLGAKIALATGASLDWLLGEANQPMPPIRRLEPEWDPKDQAQACTIAMLDILFEWLVVITARQPKTPGRKALELSLGMMLDNLKKGDQDPEAETTLETNVFEWVTQHAELIDPDLRKIINLDYLAEEQRARMEKAAKKKKSRGPKFTPPRPNRQKPRKVSAKEPPSRVGSKRSRSRR
jgi:transcriptional regulator with XRE-family HTH domain